MAAQAFTRNYSDHSNDTGFQFEFHCDKCGNGYRSSFKANKLGLAESVLKAAGSFFGGGLGSLASATGGMKDALRGGAWDTAFQEAINEIRPKFHQCTRCGNWVCPEVCWNKKRSLCESCAPDLQEEAGAIQAQVGIEQLREKARSSDQTAGVDVKSFQAAACPHCNATLEANAKFCAECGKATAGGAKQFCSECGAQRAAGAKFCAGCGAKA